MKNSDRANKRKWEAVAVYLLQLCKGIKTNLIDIAIQYKVSQSTISYGLSRLLNPTVIDVHEIREIPTRKFQLMHDTKQLSPTVIKALYDRCRIPIPAVLRDAVNEKKNNNSIQTTPTSEKNINTTKTCTNCNTELIPKAKFCHSCGHPVLITKQKALDICDCITEAIKTQFSEQYQTTYLYGLERVREYIECTEE